MATAQYELGQHRRGDSRGVGVKPVGKRKLDFGLRTTKFEQDLKALDIPKDTRELLNLALNLRVESERDKRKLIGIYIELTEKKHGKYWELFDCDSPEQLLHKKLGFPMPDTLAKWRLLWETFTTETFDTIGTDLLLEMMHHVDFHHQKVGTYEGMSGAEQAALKVEDYGKIAAWYKSKYGDVFDRQEFREVVNDYLLKTYPIKGREKVKRQKGEIRRLSIAEVEPDGGARHAEAAPRKELKVEIETCAGCREKESEIRQLKKRVKQLESFIAETLGADKIPPEVR